MANWDDGTGVDEREEYAERAASTAGGNSYNGERRKAQIFQAYAPLWERLARVTEERNAERRWKILAEDIAREVIEERDRLREQLDRIEGETEYQNPVTE